MSGCSEGRVSSMPGSVHKVPEGQMCDHEGHDHLAEVRIQGETDSMGCEFIDLCTPEADKLLAALRAPRDGYCEVHGGPGSDLKNWRDFDEGMAGRIYQACRSCRDEANKRAAEEYEEMRDYNAGFDDTFDVNCDL